MPQLNVRVGHELAERLEALRKERGISIAHLARLALEEKVDQLLAGGSLPPNPLRGRAAVLARRLGEAPVQVALQPAPVAPPTTTPQEATTSPPEAAIEVPPMPTYVDEDNHAWIPVDEVVGRLGLDTTDLLLQLDAEDFRTFGGETCISSFGINTALALARIKGLDTSLFDQELERISQAT